MNTERHPDYINLLHKIRSAQKLTTLDSLRQVVVKYGKEHVDGGELMAHFVEREAELTPYWEDEIDTMYHRRLTH